ncbi:MAG: thioredoxin domain-containing protein [Rhizobiales bacterium]|nr:thioredoxin domain-containing protein [Hyphomicrobiales bacterium]
MSKDLPAANLLGGQSSPYLLQHRHNPVHWLPWSPEALGEAARHDKPVLLSIGYASCHWCHVMAHESFEDEAIAALMNQHFVNIKVDREERPELDQIYMAALTAMGEQGGWPLTMFLTPDAKPFWGGTYFPPEPRYGRAGFPQILLAIHKAWTEDRDRIVSGAGSLSAHVATQLGSSHAPRDVTRESLFELASGIESLVDREKGGLRGAPKFPNAPMMSTLWLAALENPGTRCGEAVIISLENMLRGGIYDQIGGGLARYATDDDWIIPHFEKMLYDNAQLLTLLVHAHAAEPRELFRIRIERTADWMLRDMRDAQGTFISSWDADSEGHEGRFYTWTDAQLRGVLTDRERRDFLRTFELVSAPGWEGDPVIRLRSDAVPDETAERAAEKLFQARLRRVPPSRDGKVLTDWNGLAISALALAGRAFSRPDWTRAGAAAFQAILDARDPDGRLPHSMLGPARLYPALSTDYAAMITAAVELFQGTGDPRYLDHAESFRISLDKHHLSADGTAYCLSAEDATDVPMRIFGDVDDAMPSATAQIIEALVKLSTATDDAALHGRIGDLVGHAMGRVAHQRYGVSGIVNAAALARTARKLVIVDLTENAEFISVSNRYPDPRRVDITATAGHSETLRLPGDVAIDPSRSAAYLCEGQACLPPITDPAALERAIRPAFAKP